MRQKLPLQNVKQCFGYQDGDTNSNVSRNPTPPKKISGLLTTAGMPTTTGCQQQDGRQQWTRQTPATAGKQETTRMVVTETGFRIRIRIRICMDPHKFELLDPDPHSNSGSGSRSRRAKMTHKNRKKSRIFMFLSTKCSLLKAEGFSCSLGVLYGGLGISKLQILINKIEIKFPAINFFQF
jgi:hypothetical protein